MARGQLERPRFRVLGPVAADGPDGLACDLGGPQRRAVLAQLVLAVPRARSVDALGVGLWGDAPPPTAAKTLQVHVSKLRQVLPPGCLVTRPPGYALEVDPSECDQVVFDRAVDRARTALAGGRPEVAAEILRTALGLWRGAALADVRHLPFADGPVAHLDEAHQQAVEDRIAADLAAGRHAALVGELEGLVRDHPLRERLWSQLMTALYRCDRQADALDAYARARRHLVEELGLEPGPELRRLERDILEQTLPLAPAARATTPIVTASPASSLLRASGPVVGREQELGRLRRALEQVAGGRGAVVAVRGDEGLGKTTLIGAFCDAEAHGATVAVGRCREHLQVPYAPWADVLRQTDGEAALDLLEGEAAAADTPERRRAQLFGEVTSHLGALAARGPLVVVVDDLHWSDDASVTLLLHLAGELHRDPVLFVVAWRDREIGVGHPVNRLAHHLQRDESLALDLGPLGRADIADLLALTDPRPDEAATRTAAARIHEVTGGIPLFVADVVSALRTGDGALPAPGSDELPSIVRTLVARRLAAAGATAATTVEACAVLTEPFRAPVVADLLPDLGVDEVLVALDALVAAGLLTDGDDGYAFAHAAYRRAVDASLRSGRRQMLHAAAFRAIDRDGAGPEVVVHHGEGAGPLVPNDALVAALRDAAADAASRGAFVDAAALLSRAVDRAPAGDRPALLVTLADAQWRAGDISAAKGIAAEVLAAATEGGVDDEVLADAVVLHGTFGAGYGLDPTSIDAADAALTLVRDPVQSARLTVARAYHHAMWGSPVATALTAVAEAAETLPDPCPPGLAGEVRFAESLARLGTPDLERREQLAATLVALGRATDSPREVGRGLRVRSLVEMSAGRLDELAATLRELVTVAELTGSWLYRSDAWRWRIAAAIARGDLDQAAADLDELERVSASPLAGRAFVGTQRLLLHLARREPEPALAILEALCAVLPEDPTRSPDRHLADLFRLMVLVDIGRVEEAAEEFDRRQHLRDLDVAACRCYPAELILTARLAADFGRRDLAAPLVARLEPFSGQLVVMSWGEGLMAAADRSLAELRSLLAGQVDTAGFERAVALEEGGGAALLAARTRQRWQATAARLGTVAAEDAGVP